MVSRLFFVCFFLRPIYVILLCLKTTLYCLGWQHKTWKKTTFIFLPQNIIVLLSLQVPGQPPCKEGRKKKITLCDCRYFCLLRARNSYCRFLFIYLFLVRNWYRFWLATERHLTCLHCICIHLLMVLNMLGVEQAGSF